MNIRISVALASYNGAAFIEEQLESIARQERLPDELIVCDDGSSDQTVAVVTEFSQKVPFVVRLVQNARQLGFTANFEKALSLCTGDLIFLCDQDDVWFPSKLRVMTQIFRDNNNIAIAVNDALLTNLDLSARQGSLMINMLRMRGSDQELTWGCCTAITRAFRDLCMPFPASIQAAGFDHDTWLHFVGNLLGVRVVVKRPLQFYRRHGNNTSVSIAYRGRVSRLERLRYHRRLFLNFLRDRSKHSVDLYARLQLIKVLLGRVEQIQSQGEDAPPFAKSELTRHTKLALERRIAICRLPKSKRLTAATSFLLAGGYGSSRGIKSFVLDLLK